MKKFYFLFVFSMLFSAYSFGQERNLVEGSGPNYYDGLADQMAPMLLKSASILTDEAAVGKDALVYVDYVHGNDRVVEGLTALGYTTTLATSWSDFNTKLASGNFVLAVAFAQNQSAVGSGFSIPTVQNFIDGGGNIIFATWTSSDAAIANLFGAGLAGHYNLSTVTVTDPNLAVGISNPFSLSNAGWGIFSLGLTALPGSEVLATFENGDAAIVRGNGGKTIMLGYLSDAPGSEGRQAIFENVVAVLTKSGASLVVNAGLNQVVDEGTVVTLDASNSYDTFGRPLTYVWKAPEGITLSSTTVKKPTFTAPQVDKETKYIFLLYVNNGVTNSVYDQVVVTVRNVNHAPVANAGSSQIVNEGSSVVLNGSFSSDPDGDVITYSWVAPEGVVLTGATTATPSFTTMEVSADKTLTFTLTVSDGTLTTTSQVDVIVKQINKAPVANAGIDQVVNEGVTVTLDGTASADPDNDMLAYTWVVPNGITLSGTTTANPTFVAPEVKVDTDYSFVLTISDGTLTSTSQVKITVKQVNKAPVSNAGTAQTVKEKSVVTLNGTASVDPDGDILVYKWTAPEGITLSATTTANPIFTAPAAITTATYTFGLVVNDGSLDSKQSTVTITVTPIPTATNWISELPVRVYPNPFMDQITIDLGENPESSAQIAVYSINGGIILQTEVSSSKTTIDLARLAAGTYLVKVLNKGEIQTSKIIKR